MNRGLIEKSLRESLAVTLGFGTLLLVLEGLLGYVLPAYGRELEGLIFRLDFVRNIVGALLGADLSEGLGPGILAVIPWVHPAALVLIWAHEITFCTRVPAGEIDRATIDVLLGLPITRWTVFVCESVVWAFSGLVVLVMGMLGNFVGNSVATGSSPNQGHFFTAFVNLYCLYLAVGGIALFLSALSNRRGRAVGAAFTVVMISFLLNLIAEFWAPAKSIAFLSVLNYYRPLLVFQAEGWPWADMAVLIGIGSVFWIAQRENVVGVEELAVVADFNQPLGKLVNGSPGCLMLVLCLVPFRPANLH